jgi:hypothetical protein
VEFVRWVSGRRRDSCIGQSDSCGMAGCVECYLDRQFRAPSEQSNWDDAIKLIALLQSATSETNS